MKKMVAYDFRFKCTIKESGEQKHPGKQFGHVSKSRACGCNPGVAYITSPFHITSSMNLNIDITITISIQKGASMQDLASFLSLACQINSDSCVLKAVWGYIKIASQ